MVIFKEEEYVNSVVEVTKVSDRYMSLKLEVEGVLSVCMAQKMDVNRKRERNYGVTWTGEQNGVLRCWVGIVLRKEMQTAREQWIFQRDKKKAVVMTYTKREEHKMMHQFGTMCTHLDW